MVAVPPAIIIMNDDLVPSVRAWIEKQLHITETINGATFDQRMANDPNYPSIIKQLNERLLVIRDFREENNRLAADVVVFVKNGLAAIERNNFGPPGQTYHLKNLHWGQLYIYDY
jgi:non-homologous end joining protein Ku